MSQSIVLNAVTYTIPDVGDDGWGQNLTDYFVAIPSGVLQKSGGSFTLTADANFGATFGLVAAYIKSRTANIASGGVLRLAKSDLIEWRNNANNDDLELGIDSSDRLTYNGHPIVPATALTASKAVVTDSAGSLTTSATTATQIAYLSAATGTSGTTSTSLVFSTGATLTDPTLTGTVKIGVTLGVLHSASDGTVSASSIVNADVSASAAITLSKLAAVTGSRVLVSDASGFVSASGVTTTTLAFLDATSSIQTQLNSKQASGSYITSLTGDGTAAGPGAAALTLATVNANVGSFGSSTSIPTFTVNAKGLITAASGNVVIAPAGTLTGTTLASNVVTSSLTSVGTITSGTWTGTTIAVLNGGTGVTTSTGSGNNVLSASPTFTGTVLAAAATLSGNLTVGGNTTGDSNYGTIDAVVVNTNYIGHFTLTFTLGATNFAATQTVTVNYQRFGKMVILSIPSILATAGAGTVSTLTGTGLPTNLNPVNNPFMPIIVTNNGATQTTVGVFQISGGNINIYRDATGTAYTANQQCGWPTAIHVCYLTS